MHRTGFNGLGVESPVPSVDFEEVSPLAAYMSNI